MHRIHHLVTLHAVLRTGSFAIAARELDYTASAALADVRWADGDVLAVGSGTSGPIARVFLGSRASKILRHSPVPVILVPRGVAEERVSRQETETT